MFVIKTILTAFLLPPGFFIFLLIGFGTLFFIQKNRKPALFNFFIGFLIWFFSITPVTNTMLKILESDYYSIKNPCGDVIILLGDRVYDNMSDFDKVGAPSDRMLRRIYAAAKLQKINNISIIISHGQIHKNEIWKADVIERYLLEFGVKKSRILKEKKSRNTYENARFSREICLQYGFKSPIIVTSAFHLKRSVLSFKKLKMEVKPFPAHFLSWSGREYGWEFWLPKYSNLNNSSIALQEFLGLVYYNIVY